MSQDTQTVNEDFEVQQEPECPPWLENYLQKHHKVEFLGWFPHPVRGTLEPKIRMDGKEGFIKAPAVVSVKNVSPKSSGTSMTLPTRAELSSAVQTLGQGASETRQKVRRVVRETTIGGDFSLQSYLVLVLGFLMFVLVIGIVVSQMH